MEIGGPVQSGSFARDTADFFLFTCSWSSSCPNSSACLEAWVHDSTSFKMTMVVKILGCGTFWCWIIFSHGVKKTTASSSLGTWPMISGSCLSACAVWTATDSKESHFTALWLDLWSSLYSSRSFKFQSARKISRQVTSPTVDITGLTTITNPTQEYTATWLV